MTVPKCPLFGDSTYHYMSECQVYTKPTSLLRGCSHSACTGSWSAIGVFVCTDRLARGVCVYRLVSYRGVCVYRMVGYRGVCVYRPVSYRGVCVYRMVGYRGVCVHRPVG